MAGIEALHGEGRWVLANEGNRYLAGATGDSVYLESRDIFAAFASCERAWAVTPNGRYVIWIDGSEQVEPTKTLSQQTGFIKIPRLRWMSTEQFTSPAVFTSDTPRWIDVGAQLSADALKQNPLRQRAILNYYKNVLEHSKVRMRFNAAGDRLVAWSPAGLVVFRLQASGNPTKPQEMALEVNLDLELHDSLCRPLFEERNYTLRALDLNDKLSEMALLLEKGSAVPKAGVTSGPRHVVSIASLDGRFFQQNIMPQIYRETLDSDVKPLALAFDCTGLILCLLAERSNALELLAYNTLTSTLSAVEGGGLYTERLRAALGSTSKERRKALQREISLDCAPTDRKMWDHRKVDPGEQSVDLDYRHGFLVAAVGDTLIPTRIEVQAVDALRPDGGSNLDVRLDLLEGLDRNPVLREIEGRDGLAVGKRFTITRSNGRLVILGNDELFLEYRLPAPGVSRDLEAPLGYYLSPVRENFLVVLGSSRPHGHAYKRSLIVYRFLDRETDWRPPVEPEDQEPPSIAPDGAEFCCDNGRKGIEAGKACRLKLTFECPDWAEDPARVMWQTELLLDCPAIPQIDGMRYYLGRYQVGTSATGGRGRSHTLSLPVANLREERGNLANVKIRLCFWGYRQPNASPKYSLDDNISNARLAVAPETSEINFGDREYTGSVGGQERIGLVCNRNGRPDPGETVLAFVRVTNSSTGQGALLGSWLLSDRSVQESPRVILTPPGKPKTKDPGKIPFGEPPFDEKAGLCCYPIVMAPQTEFVSVGVRIATDTQPGIVPIWFSTVDHALKAPCRIAPNARDWEVEVPSMLEELPGRMRLSVTPFGVLEGRNSNAIELCDTIETKRIGIWKGFVWNDSDFSVFGTDRSNSRVFRDVKLIVTNPNVANNDLMKLYAVGYLEGQRFHPIPGLEKIGSAAHLTIPLGDFPVNKFVDTLAFKAKIFERRGEPTVPLDWTLSDESGDELAYHPEDTIEKVVFEGYSTRQSPDVLEPEKLRPEQIRNVVWDPPVEFRSSGSDENRYQFDYKPLCPEGEADSEHFMEWDVLISLADLEKKPHLLWAQNPRFSLTLRTEPDTKPFDTDAILRVTLEGNDQRIHLYHDERESHPIPQMPGEKTIGFEIGCDTPALPDGDGWLGKLRLTLSAGQVQPKDRTRQLGLSLVVSHFDSKEPLFAPENSDIAWDRTGKQLLATVAFHDQTDLTAKTIVLEEHQPQKWGESQWTEISTISTREIACSTAKTSEIIDGQPHKLYTFKCAFPVGESKWYDCPFRVKATVKDSLGHIEKIDLDRDDDPDLYRERRPLTWVYFAALDYEKSRIDNIGVQPGELEFVEAQSMEFVKRLVSLPKMRARSKFPGHRPPQGEVALEDFESVSYVLNPNVQSFWSNLDAITSRCRKDDNLIIGLQGHGIRTGESKKNIYFLLHDCDCDARGEIKGGISFFEILNHLAERVATQNLFYRKLVFLFDFCHSGAFQGGSDDIVIDERDKRPADLKYFIVSSTEHDEPVQLIGGKGIFLPQLQTVLANSHSLRNLQSKLRLRYRSEADRRSDTGGYLYGGGERRWIAEMKPSFDCFPKGENELERMLDEMLW